MSTSSHSRKRFRRLPVNPWSQHNLNLIKAACDVSLRKHGLRVEQGFNYGQHHPRRKQK